MEEDQYNKPSYDGRIHYFMELNRILSNLNNAIMNEDIENCLKGLMLFKNHIYAYIRNEDKKKSDLIMRDLELQHKMIEYNSKHISNVNNHILKKILNVHGQLMVFAKELLLPLSSDEITEWSDEEFLKGT
jgi:hypothetical protein